MSRFDFLKRQIRSVVPAAGVESFHFPKCLNGQHELRWHTYTLQITANTVFPMRNHVFCITSFMLSAKMQYSTK